MNLYQYTWNNPVNFIDPYGLWGDGGVGSARVQFETRKIRQQSNAFYQGYFSGIIRGTIDQFGAGANFWGNVFKGNDIGFGAHPGSGADQACKFGGEGWKTGVQISSVAAIVTTAFAIAGPPNAWVRFGPSYNKALGEATKFSIRFGSNAHYAKLRIGSELLRKLAIWIKENIGHIHIF